MTPMRTAARTVAATAAALLLPSLLTGCVVDGGWLGGPAAPTTSTEAPATTATAAPTPAPEPLATWPVNVPVQPGDCDPQAPDALLVTFVLGHVVGRRAAIRHCAQLLRDACHLDAATLIDRRTGRWPTGRVSRDRSGRGPVRDQPPLDLHATRRRVAARSSAG